MVPGVPSRRQGAILRRAMASRKDVGGGEGRRGRYAVEEQNMVGRGNEEDTGAGACGRKLLRGPGR